MVKFSIRPLVGTEKIIVTNMSTGAKYETSKDSMRRLWDYFIPTVRYMDSDGIRTEGIHVADLHPDFEVGVKNNPYTGGSRRRALRKYNKSNRLFRKKSRTTRRR